MVGKSVGFTGRLFSRLMTGIILSVILLMANKGVIAQSFTWSGSFQYSGGSYYFTERTDSFYFTNSLSVAGERTRVTFNIPYVVQSTPWISYGPEGVRPTGGSRHGQVGMGSGAVMMPGGNPQDRRRDRVHLPDSDIGRHSGFSDPSMNISLRITQTHLRSPTIHLNSMLKVPLASPSSGFGSGSWDFGFGISLLQPIGTWISFADVMYLWMGDMEELELNNPLTYGIGLGRGFKEGRWLMSISLNGMTRWIDEYDPPVNVGIGITYSISSHITLSTSVSAGFTETSPDLSLGAGWSTRF